ncbi:MAG: family 1 glycosylhydrolase, partial [Pseudomonadota bacterium]
TFNEPWCTTWLSHFHGMHAPGLRDIRATARSIHHLLLAHNKSIAVMRDAGMENLGIYLNFEPAQPASDTKEAKAAAARYHAYYNECFLEPLMGRGYPTLVLDGIEPQLPERWEDDLSSFATPLDWLGINNYTRKLIDDDDTGVWPHFKEVPGPLPKTEMGWEVSPDTFEWLLKWVSDKANGLPLYISENGMAGPDVKDGDTVNDPWRIDFLDQHIHATKRAMDSGANIKGYTVWSLLDNYEWSLGYEKRFGIVYVNYETLERTPKASWHALKAALI